MFGPGVEAARFGLWVVGVPEVPWFAGGDGLSAECADGPAGVDGGFDLGAQAAVVLAVSPGGGARLGPGSIGLWCWRWPTAVCGGVKR